MISLNVRVDGANSVRAYLAGRAKQVKFATALALTRTAGDIKSEIPAALDRDLDRPTEFTKRGVFVRPARADALAATVGFMPAQAKYLGLQIEGGTRVTGAAGAKLPSAIQVNQFGNVPRGLIAQLIAVARKEKGLGRAKGRRIKVSSKLSLFYGDPPDQRRPRGIYKDIEQGGRRVLIPLIVFPRVNPVYRPRFRFAELGAKIVASNWRRNFDTALDEAIRTAR